MKQDRFSGLAPRSAELGAPTEYGPARWYLLALLTVVNLMGAIDRVVVSVISEPLKIEFNLTDKELGALTGLAYTASFALAVLPMGWMVDRYNRRRLLSITVTLWSALTTACSWAGSYMALFLLRMGVGAGEAPIIPTSMSLIADTFPLHRRNTAISLFLCSAGLGMLIQFMLGGWLLGHYGWRIVFLVAGAPGLVVAALLFFSVREPSRGVYDKAINDRSGIAEQAPTAVQALRRIISDGALLLTVPAITVTTGVVASMVLWGTSFLVRVHSLTVTEAAMWMALGFGICMTAGSLLAGPFADFVSQGNLRKLTLVPAVAALIAAISGVVLALAQDLTFAVAALGVFGFMGGVFLGPGYAIILGQLASNERGIVFASIKVFSTLVGGSAITFMTGAISDAVGGKGSIQPAIFANAVLLVVATICFVSINLILGRREQARRVDVPA